MLNIDILNVFYKIFLFLNFGKLHIEILRIWECITKNLAENLLKR